MVLAYRLHRNTAGQHELVVVLVVGKRRQGRTNGDRASRRRRAPSAGGSRRSRRCSWPRRERPGRRRARRRRDRCPAKAGRPGAERPGGSGPSTSWRLLVLRGDKLDVRTRALLRQDSCSLEEEGGERGRRLHGPGHRRAALAEPVRRELYLYVVGKPEPVSTDQAAEGPAPLLDALGHPATARLDPAPRWCCVVVDDEPGGRTDDFVGPPRSVG